MGGLVPTTNGQNITRVRFGALAAPKPVAPKSGEERSGGNPQDVPAKQSETAGPSFILPNPINYASPIDYDMIASMLRQKWEIIENVMNSFKPTQDEIDEQLKLDEKKFIEKKELAAAQDKLMYVKQQAKRLMGEIEAIIASLSMPTANPKARAAVLAEELGRISKAISALCSEMAGTIKSLDAIDSSDPQVKEQKNSIATIMSDVKTALEDISSLVDRLEKGIEQ